MKNGKASRAMQHLDDELISAAMTESEKREYAHLVKGKGKTVKNKGFWTKLTAVAAAFILVFGVGFFSVRLSRLGAGATIALDVNPSIEIEIGGNEKVIEVRAINEDSQAVLAGLDLNGMALEDAVDRIVEALVEHGYISADKNSILVSVNTKNGSRADALKSKLTGEIEEVLGGKSIDVSLMVQTFEKNDDAESKANHHHISTAKASLITKIVAAGLLDANGVPYTYEVLAGLKIHELRLILDSKNIKVDGTSATGTANAGDYISVDEALGIALGAAEIEKSATLCLEIEMDFDDDISVMVYEVEFCNAENKFEYEINAKTGEIIEAEIEPKEGHRHEHGGNGGNGVNGGNGGHGGRYDDTAVLPENSIGRERALEIAYNDAGIKAENARRPEIEVDTENGKVVFEVEFKSAGMEYEYKIDALSGEIIERESEPCN